MSSSELLISRTNWESRVARLENGNLVEYHVERDSERGIVGNLYKGKVSRVLPGMQAAFVEIGLSRTGFLYVSNIVDPEAVERAPLQEKKIELEDDPDDLVSEQGTALEVEESVVSRAPLPDISKLIQEGQSLMVQVTKEAMGTKGARLTGVVSIPGRFLVYLPYSNQIGISRRIENQEERTRLKDIVDKHAPKEGGLIIRTVAEGATEKHLKDDLEYLLKLWGTIKKSFDKQKKPGLLYSDLDLSMKVLRDRVTEDVSKIIVDDAILFKKLSKFIQNYLPRFKNRIELYKEGRPLFDLYGIEPEINRAIAKKVWLKSGGYIVIDETEALTSIDVNTGRFVGKRNLEETILQTNLEAVKETAYQIRLRNLGGIIILDFIDMEKELHKENIYEAFLEELKKDPVRTNVLPVSDLGLIQMTRKRTQESLRQKLTSPCGTCEGKGYIKSHQTISHDILRECVKEMSVVTGAASLIVYCHPEIASFLTDDEKSYIEEIEKMLGIRLSIKVDPKLHLEDYELFAKDS